MAELLTRRIPSSAILARLAFADASSRARVTGVGRLPHQTSCAVFGAINAGAASPARLHKRRLLELDVRAANFDLAPPPIDNDLYEVMEESGAQFSDEGVALTFGNDDLAVQASTTGVAIYDMSHFGRIRVTGDDRIRFLHNQSTANFEALSAGQGCETVFVTATARTIDLASAWVMGQSVILTVSPSKRRELLKMLDNYIFFADKVKVEDITEKTKLVAVLGPESDQIMSKLGLGDIVGKPAGTNQHFKVDGLPVTVTVGSGLAVPGYRLLVSTDTAGMVWSALLAGGAEAMGEAAWECLRIVQGRPVPGKELTPEFNALEAGLWQTISTSKGCYIGQETIARLITYNGVKQHLWSIQLARQVAEGTPITLEGKGVGKLTSCTVTPDGSIVGLGYVSKLAGGEGLQVDVGGVVGVLSKAPYLLQALPQ